MRRLLLALAIGLACLAPAAAQAPVPPLPPASPAPVRLTLEGLTRLALRETSGTLFENVAKMLAANYVDVEFRTQTLPGLVERYRGQAAAAATIEAQRAVVHEFLSHVPASHLGLLSTYGHRALMADLLQAPYPTFGFQVIGAGADRYAGMVLEGGPAARAGLLHGDRLVAVDGTPIQQSARLDWRTDDAHIGDERDPSVQYLMASAGDRIALRVERRPGEFITINVRAEDYTAFDAAEASVRVIRTAGKSVGYLHFWYVHFTGVPELLARAADGRLKDVNALVLDLRGRGGSATEVTRIVAWVRAYRERTGKPVVALADRQSRSGKDVLLYEFRQIGVRIVGEASAGAVIPASFADVGHGMVLMFPTTRLPKYTDLLELKPVVPDVPVARPGLFAAGTDPILEAGVAEALRLVAGLPLPSSP